MTTPPTILWAAPDAKLRDQVCPNCGADSAKTLLLTVDFTPPHRARQLWPVLRCPDCTCCFYERQAVADYSDDEMLTRGRAELYVQQGAGLSQLCRPIGRLALPVGSRLLDIGCGFGFGLDFALRAKGWVGQGIDPAQIAGLGSAMLGLPIEQRLLDPDDDRFRGACDVVMSAETIEHVPDPAAFLRVLTAALAPGSVLVLTTPDADALRPDTAPGQLVGLLSPELHMVLQSAASLRFLLAGAGFTHIEIDRDGGSLVATASTRALPISTDPGAFQPVFCDYLEARAADFTASDDLFWGFAGRALLEAANAGDWRRANRLRPLLKAACLSRFGIDLDRPVLPSDAAHANLSRLATLMPLNLAAILYADAMRLLCQGARRPSQQARLRCAAEAARQLHRAVGELAMTDAMSEELAWVAEAEALLCEAGRFWPTNLVPRLRALPPAPGRDGAARRAVMLRRALDALIQGRRHAEARALAGDAALAAASMPAGRFALSRAVIAWARQGLAGIRQRIGASRNR